MLTEARGGIRNGDDYEVRGLGRTIARKTITNSLTVLRRVLQEALDEGLVPRNVAADVRVPKQGRTTERWTYLRPAEIECLLSSPAASMELRAVLATAIYQGPRRGEQWGLRWEDVFLDVEQPYIVWRYSYDGPRKR